MPVVKGQKFDRDALKYSMLQRYSIAIVNSKMPLPELKNEEYEESSSSSEPSQSLSKSAQEPEQL